MILGADALLCVLYETDNQESFEDPEHLEMIPQIWRFRIPISLEHMRQEFESRAVHADKKLAVLRLFLEEVIKTF